MKKLIKIPTKNMTHEEWLKHRQNSIGGSDCATILGLSNWSTPYSLWARKRGLLPELEDNEAMRQGRDLEDYVAHRWCEVTGKKTRRENNIIINPKYPFAHANVDRMVVGENAGLECKTTNSMTYKHYKGTEYPDQYYTQCMHYMAVTGAERWYLAVLVLGKELLTYTIERDEAEIEALMSAEAEFCELMQNDTPPDVDGYNATSNAIADVYKESKPDAIPLIAKDDLINRYLKYGELIDEFKQKQEEIKQELMLYLADNEIADSDKYRVSWRTQHRSSFDSKRFMSDNPDLDLSKYLKETTFRRFSIREQKGEE